MIVDVIKRSVRLRPYFLWYMKCMLRMPQVEEFLEIEDQHTVRSKRIMIQNYNESYEMLIEQLLDRGLTQDQAKEAIIIVCQHYFNMMDSESIMNGTPELLILSKPLLN